MTGLGRPGGAALRPEPVPVRPAGGEIHLAVGGSGR